LGWVEHHVLHGDAGFRRVIPALPAGQPDVDALGAGCIDPALRACLRDDAVEAVGMPAADYEESLPGEPAVEAGD